MVNYKYEFIGVDCNMLNKKLVLHRLNFNNNYCWINLFYTRQKQLQNRNPEAIITDVKLIL